MATYELIERKTIDAVQWFKDGDHPAVQYEGGSEFQKKLREVETTHRLVPWTKGKYLIHSASGLNEVLPGDYISRDGDRYFLLRKDFFERTYRKIET